MVPDKTLTKNKTIKLKGLVPVKTLTKTKTIKLKGLVAAKTKTKRFGPSWSGRSSASKGQVGEVEHLLKANQ